MGRRRQKGELHAILIFRSFLKGPAAKRPVETFHRAVSQLLRAQKLEVQRL
nr:MAG TPA: hypothetical protein [Caudoviricetes sp.]